MKPHLHPQYIPADKLPLLLNIKPSTYPAEPLDTSVGHYQSIPFPIPRKLWEGDWVVDIENDIQCLASHFHTQPGDFMWIQEKHRFTTEPNEEAKDGMIWVNYMIGDPKPMTARKWDIKFFDRWLPPIGMLRNASRLVFGVDKIDVRWLDEKRTDLLWVVEIVRHPNPEQVFAEADKK